MQNSDRFPSFGLPALKVPVDRTSPAGSRPAFTSKWTGVSAAAWQLRIVKAVEHNLRSRFMQVREVMSANVVSINVDTPLDQALAAMQMNQVGFLPVTHEKVCVGVLTEQDINDELQKPDVDPAVTTAGTLLSHGKHHDAVGAVGVHAISEEATVVEARQLMADLRVHHLAVHDEEFRMVGVISRRDLEFDRPDVPVPALSGK
jgi:CBS domain-containing protein